jgi:apolipoprotein N-acyltransferase
MKGSSTRATILVSSATVLLLWLALIGGGEIWPLLAVACVPFFVHICRVNRKQAVICALFTGVGHFLLQLYWIVFVLGHYGGLPLFVSVPALLLLCLYMAGYVLVFVLLARLFVQRFSPYMSLWLLPAAWVGLDYLRSFVFSGFPWMDLGYGVAGIPFLFQSADLWGHYGLTFLIVLINTFIALSILNNADRRVAMRLAVPVSLLCITTVLYSGWRWQQVEKTLQQAEFINIGVVQGNVDQDQKWNPARQEITVRNYVEQSLRLMRPGDTQTLRPDLLVWPETSLPFYPVNHPLLMPIERLVQDEQVMLLTGSPWYEREGLQAEKIKFFNSSLLFDVRGEIVARTSKSHLVPFGEYVPFKDFLPFIAPLVEAVGDFSRGEIRNPPACKTARIGVLICFESIFGDISRKWVDAGANLLVNMTNDAWYGKSSAPYQTLAMTRLRAVETRRSIVRPANTGFSGFIDPMGRLLHVSPLFVSWEASEQVAIMEERTFFVRGGYLFAPACLILTCLGLMVGTILIYRERRVSL